MGLYGVRISIECRDPRKKEKSESTSLVNHVYDYAHERRKIGGTYSTYYIG